MDKPIYTEFGEICAELGIQATRVSDPSVPPREDMLDALMLGKSALEDLHESKTIESSVEHPSHYTSGGIECIDAMKAMLAGYERAKIVTKFYWHFLSGQVLKYLWRWPLKERPLQDLKKARWYLDRLIDDVENQDHAVTELHFDMGREISE